MIFNKQILYCLNENNCKATTAKKMYFCGESIHRGDRNKCPLKTKFVPETLMSLRKALDDSAEALLDLLIRKIVLEKKFAVSYKNTSFW